MKAIIFDCFGVLTVDGWLKFCDQHFKDGPGRQKARELNHQSDAGVLSYEDFLKKLQDLSGVEPAEIQRQLYENHPKNTQLLEYIRSLKNQGYKIGILSNISRADWFKEFFTPQEYKLFDEFTLSIEVGVIKPAPEIYKMAAQRLKVAPQECVFIDDRDVYAKASGTVGMKGIVYQNFEQFKKDLENILAADTNR